LQRKAHSPQSGRGLEAESPTCRSEARRQAGGLTGEYVGRKARPKIAS